MYQSDCEEPSTKEQSIHTSSSMNTNINPIPLPLPQLTNTNSIPPPLPQPMNTNTSGAFYKNSETNKKFDIIPYDQLIHILPKLRQILEQCDYDSDKGEEK